MRVFAVCIGLACLTAVSFGLGHRWASLDPQGEKAGRAAAAALAEPNELVRAAGLLPILSQLRAEQLDAVVGAYEATLATSVGPGSVALELLGEAWARLDPVGGLQRIMGWHVYWWGPQGQDRALPSLLHSWARRDPAAARNALAGIESPELRSAAIAAVIRGWAESGDPDVWQSYVAGLPFGEEAARELFARVATREGVGGLLQRVEALPEETEQGFKPRAIELAVRIAARSDPEQAAAFVERQTHSPETGRLKAIVAGVWVASDGPRAMAWLLEQPPDAGRDRLFRFAFQNWLRLDREAALAWASAQADPTLAPVGDLYERPVAKTEAEPGIAEGVPDPEARRKAMPETGRVRAPEDE